MDYKTRPIRLLLAFILVNVIGFALKYFELDTYLILLGFRFHLAAIIPLLVIIKSQQLSLLKNALSHPQFVKGGRVILLFVFVNVLFISFLFLLKKIEIGDPEYFYEFGLSSIIDYPIYLIWNAFQLVFLYFFLLIVKKSFKYEFIILFVTCALILIYEFIPVTKFSFDYETITSFLVFCLICSIIMKYFNNVYLFVILIFSINWFNVLSFGSSSHTLIKLLFAANYDSWEGFFTVDKINSDFLIPANIFLIFISLLIYKLVSKRKHTLQIN